jgi:antibiotic biosynthesis monooxygenase (ABM) superfamily enzyme
MFEEAEPEFQTMAFFKTNIAIRNALQVICTAWNILISPGQVSLLYHLVSVCLLDFTFLVFFTKIGHNWHGLFFGKKIFRFVKIIKVDPQWGGGS